MAITGIFTQKRVGIGSFTFDATLEESDELNTEVTRYAIENGVEGNDSAVTRNQRFSLTLGMTDNPFVALSSRLSQSDVLGGLSEFGLSDGAVSSIIGGAAGIGVGAATNLLGGRNAALAGLGTSIASAAYAAGQAATRSSNALDELRRLQRNTTIFTLTNNRGVYENCIITGTRQTTTPRNERGLEVVVDIEQLRIMNTERVARSTGIPVQGGDTATTMAMGERRRGIVPVKVLPPG